jgi:putative transcriptional regulator
MSYFENNHIVFPEKGDLLISEPFLPDPNFERTVILLCEHNEEDSFGFVLNKPSLLKFNDVISSFRAFNEALFVGGPVQQDTLHFVHRAGDLIEGGEPLGNGLFWGGNIEQLMELINKEGINPNDFRFFLGYSGWSSGQLLDEINQKSWIVHKSATCDQVFDSRPEDLWREVLRNMGGRYKMFSNYPVDPRLN